MIIFTDITGSRITLGDCIVIGQPNSIIEVGRIVNMNTTTFHIETTDGYKVYPLKTALYSHRMLLISEERYEEIKRKQKDVLLKLGGGMFPCNRVGVT